MSLIYHITTRAEWQQAQQAGEYTAPSLASQGFIHCSTLHQITRVANAIYRGQSELVILCIETGNLTAELRVEPPDTNIHADHKANELFPHIYGALNLDAVTGVVAFPSNEDGTFALPAELGA
jgi:uncharacterized protein (DUF952 family)